MIVLDASVLLKCILKDEAGYIKAKGYLERHASRENNVAVPGLFFYEIANALSTKVVLTEEDAKQAFSFLWDLDFEIFDFGLDEFLSGIALAKKYGMTLYDASYIELARKLNCNFITADRELYEKASEMKVVKLL